MNKYEESYRRLNTYITTMEKMLYKEQSPLIKECKANLYSLVKKEDKMLGTKLTSNENGWFCICPRCGSKVSSKNARCGNCGQKIMWDGVL